MDLVVKEVDSVSGIKRFVDFQNSLYQENNYFVPPPRKEEIATFRENKNPAFDFCKAKLWLAYHDGKAVGRIAGIINDKFNSKFNKKEARFGWIDFIDDEEVSTLLLKTVEDWAKQNGMNSIHGPLGFTDFDPEGTLIEGFEELGTLGAIYNYDYYPQLIEKSGYVKDMDWLEFEVTIDKSEIPDKVSRIADIALKRNKLKLLKVKKAKEILPYARDIFYLINDAYKDLYGFVELSDRQIDMYVKQYFGFIIPEYVPVVLDENNKVVAFGITMPSMSRAFQKCGGRLFPLGFITVLKAMKNNNAVDLYLTAVKPELQDKGVNAILISEINKLLIHRNITKVETNRELETNHKVQAQWKFYTTRQHKRRRCYKKDL